MSSGPITRYTLEDSGGNAVDDRVWEADEFTAAADAARAEGLRVIEHEYEWTDSCLIADYSDKETA